MKRITHSSFTYIQDNQPKHAGRQASNVVYFGRHDRYAVCAVHTRFEHVSWFVYDRTKPEWDLLGNPEDIINFGKTGLVGLHVAKIIRQEPTLQRAIRGIRFGAEV